MAEQGKILVVDDDRLVLATVTHGLAQAGYEVIDADNGDDAILLALSLIDLSLAANLLLIVLFSGYENFVSKLDIDDGGDRPDWMGKVDFSGLKMKLIASIVAISGIHLLKRFMEISDLDTATTFGETEMYWLVVIHLTFVVSGVLMALMDWLQARAAK